MRIGVDLGGTKIEAVAIDDAGVVRWQRRIATPREWYEGTIEAIQQLVQHGEAAVQESCTVGIGIPGAESQHSGFIKNANSTWLIGRPFRADLSAALQREVRLANDANCLAVSESVDGAAAGADVVFAVILGTGTGGGLVVRGQLVAGANAIGGEWGHNPLPWPMDDERPGPSCYCGRTGCIETFLSGPGLAADYARRTETALAIPSEQVVTRAAEGDVLAQQALDMWEDRLARALATVMNIVDPDVIVVGGGLSRIERLYANVPTRWGKYVFSDDVVTRLVPAAHGDASGVRGAAWLWGRT
ncbi:MAG: ROK family protein [Acidobacteria bacterium]|nr:ROK family protein [Acidobacteriota bacterium]